MKARSKEENKEGVEGSETAQGGKLSAQDGWVDRKKQRIIYRGNLH